MKLRKNTLLRMKVIVDEYKKHEHPGVSAAYIYRNYIFPKFYISKSHYCDCLSTPIDLLLKEYDNEESNN